MGDYVGQFLTDFSLSVSVSLLNSSFYLNFG
uniref:Uncharacterized protein n=1 Tax=Rhizophora mucronata TaxID=61149 RepID=A0A2P2KTP4_RHIMU